MILSVLAVTGCSEEEDAPEVSKDTGAKTITLRVITEKKVCNTQAELDEYLEEECEGDKESSKYKDMVATMKAYNDVEAEIAKITKSTYKTNVDILFYTEDEYYTELEQAMKDYVLEQQNAAFAARALDKYMKEYKAYDPTASDASIKKSFYKYFPEYKKYKNFNTTDENAATGGDQYVKNETTGIKELVYPEAEENQIDVIYISGYDMYMDYIEKEWIQGLNAYISTTGKKLTYFISPTLLDGVKVENETYAIPNNVQIGSYTYMLVDKDLAQKYHYPYSVFDSLVDEDCRAFMQDICKNEAAVLPIDSTFDECMSLYTWYWNVEFNSKEETMGVPTYTVNTDNKFSILGSYISDPSTLGRGQIELGFTSLFTDEQYRETFLCLKEYQFNDCFNTDYAGSGEATAIQFTEGNYAMYRNAFYNDKGELKKESDESYGIYTDENGKEYYLYVAKYPEADEESLYGNMFAVCSNTKYTQACMEVITLLNTDPAVRNLLQYGIKQGEHRDGQSPNYKVNKIIDENGNETETITILNDMYQMDIKKTGNCFIAYPEEGLRADYWEDAKAQNNDALIDPLAGFDFNVVLDPTSGSKLDVRYLIDTAVAVNDKTGKVTEIDTDLEKLNAIVLEGINNCGEDYEQLENYVNNVLATNLTGNNVQIGTSPSMDLDKVTDKTYDPNKEDENGNIDENGESPYAIYFKWVSSLK